MIKKKMMVIGLKEGKSDAWEYFLPGVAISLLLYCSFESGSIFYLMSVQGEVHSFGPWDDVGLRPPCQYLLLVGGSRRPTGKQDDLRPGLEPAKASSRD